jgi:hypothetical protein
MFCDGCGKPVAECRGCLPELDPPRYCAECGRWLAVRVHTGGWAARCPTHGETVSPPR